MISFRKAIENDAMMLLSWRNDPETRGASRHSAQILPKGHRAWLGVTLQNPDCFLYIAEQDNVPVGTVRFDRRADGFELSWTVASGMRGKGIGSRMLNGVLSLHTPPFFAEIKSSNKASQKIAKRAGFALTEERAGMTYWMYPR